MCVCVCVLPYKGPEARGSHPHGSLDPEEAEEDGSDAVDHPQVVELLGVLGEDLLQAQRGEGVVLRPRLLHRALLHQDVLLLCTPVVMETVKGGRDRKRERKGEG